MFYINEKGESRYIVFYIHGGAYRHDFIAPHWLFIEKLVNETNALVIAPGYRLAPFATYREAFDLILPVYREICGTHPDKKIIVMSDSAGGGFSVALAKHCKASGLRLPDELVLMSPWVDAVMDSEEIVEYQARDPFLCADSLRVVARTKNHSASEYFSDGIQYSSDLPCCMITDQIAGAHFPRVLGECVPAAFAVQTIGSFSSRTDAVCFLSAVLSKVTAFRREAPGWPCSPCGRGH